MENVWFFIETIFSYNTIDKIIGVYYLKVGSLFTIFNLEFIACHTWFEQLTCVVFESLYKNTAQQSSLLKLLLGTQKQNEKNSSQVKEIES